MHNENSPNLASFLETLLHAKETQRRLGVGATTLNKLVHLKWLTPVRFSKRLVRYRASEVEALIETAAKNGGVL